MTAWYLLFANRKALAAGLGCSTSPGCCCIHLVPTSFLYFLCNLPIGHTLEDDQRGLLFDLCPKGGKDCAMGSLHTFKVSPFVLTTIDIAKCTVNTVRSPPDVFTRTTCSPRTAIVYPGRSSNRTAVSSAVRLFFFYSDIKTTLASTDELHHLTLLSHTPKPSIVL